MWITELTTALTRQKRILLRLGAAVAWAVGDAVAAVRFVRQTVVFFAACVGPSPVFSQHPEMGPTSTTDTLHLGFA